MLRIATRWVTISFVLICVAAVLLVVSLPVKGVIPILNYHFVVPEELAGPTSLDVTTTAFEKQMRLLKALGFRPISIGEFEAIKKGEQEARGKEILITFDDGNESYSDYALPIMAKHGIPSVNFLILENIKQKLHGSMDLARAERVARHPLVTLGSHTLTHPVLPELGAELKKAEIVDIRGNIKGFMIVRPWGALTMENMFKLYEHALQQKGHLPTFFPSLISEKNLTKESEHVQGFTPEVFWLETKKGEERLALRPTSETMFTPAFALWIRGHKELPMKLYQRGSVFRLDTKSTRPLIRSREIMWIEAHDAFATKEEAEAQVQEDIQTTEEVMHQ